jgi:hypothetical protein
VFGTIAASALFVGIPAVFLLGSTSDFTRWLLPTVMVTWAIAMAVFRSPAMCLLGNFAFATQLPQAASILTLAGGVASSLRPFTNKFILGLGAAATFTIGSLVLLAAVAYLRAVAGGQSSPTNAEVDTRAPLQSFLDRLLVLLVIGAGMGLGVRLLLGEVIPKIFQAEIANVNQDLLMGSLFIVQAGFAIASGMLATRVGNTRLMAVSLGLIAACLGLLTVAKGSLLVGVLALVLVFFFSAALNGAIPLALEWVPAGWGGLGVGTYFGGFSAAISMFGFIVTKPNEMLTISSSILLAAIAFLVAGATIMISARPAKPLSTNDSSSG